MQIKNLYHKLSNGIVISDRPKTTIMKQFLDFTRAISPQYVSQCNSREVVLKHFSLSKNSKNFMSIKILKDIVPHSLFLFLKLKIL